MTPGLAFAERHDRYVRASEVFPLEDRFWKATVYMDVAPGAPGDDATTLRDIVRALVVDPYAPDLLQAQIWFLLKGGKRAEAEQAAHTLYRTEGCIDCWVRKQ